MKQFLREYWQKKPLVIRQCFPDFSPRLHLPELAALAARDDVEARIVSAFRGHWKLRHGPFEVLPARRRDWTLLVQGANLFVPSLDSLLARFAFLPFTRLDDVMVSYAVEGGSVGPHFDSYDVFLFQAQGRRRWRISSQQDLELLEDLPLKILQNFSPTQEWVLEPGDVLYLPPQIAHEGVALDACMTYSIGFRAPGYTELAREFLFSVAERTELPGRYADATSAPVEHPAEIDNHLLADLAEQLGRIRWTSADITAFAGRYFSEPKAQVFFKPPKKMPRGRFVASALRHGLRVDPKTRLLYRDENMFINGESVHVGKHVRKWLRQFADMRQASGLACQEIARRDELSEILHAWFGAGWIIKGG